MEFNGIFLAIFYLLLVVMVIATIVSNVHSFCKDREYYKKSLKTQAMLQESILHNNPFEATGFVLSRMKDGRIKIAFTRPCESSKNQFFTVDVIVSSGIAQRLFFCDGAIDQKPEGGNA